MDAALIASATLLGLAGAPHCAAMCAAPCAALCGLGPARTVAFQAARSVGALAALAQWSPVLRPLWAVLQALVLTTGLWMLVQGHLLPGWEGWGVCPLRASGSR